MFRYLYSLQFLSQLCIFQKLDFLFARWPMNILCVFLFQQVSYCNLLWFSHFAPLSVFSVFTISNFVKFVNCVLGKLQNIRDKMQNPLGKKPRRFTILQDLLVPYMRNSRWYLFCLIILIISPISIITNDWFNVNVNGTNIFSLWQFL